MSVPTVPFESLLWCCDRWCDPGCGSSSVGGVDRGVVEDVLWVFCRPVIRARGCGGCLELLVGSEWEENSVEKCIWGEGYGGGDGEWEAALKEELLVVEH